MNERLTSEKYAIYKGAVMIIGLLSMIVFSAKTINYLSKINIFIVLAAYLIIAYFGVRISRYSSDVRYSLTGFVLVIMPLGVVLNLLLKKISQGLVQHVVLIAIITTIVMTVVAYKRQKIFKSEGEELFIPLVALFILELVGSLFWFKSTQIVDSIVAIIFSMYLIGNWKRSLKYELTIQAVIDSCVEIYVVPINKIAALFKRE